MNDVEPAFAHISTGEGSIKVGVSRLDAPGSLESTLFSGALVIISFSGWTSGRDRRSVDIHEIARAVTRLYGPDTLAKLRRATLGGGAVYLVGLAVDGAFSAPTMLQDAALARAFDARPFAA